MLLSGAMPYGPGGSMTTTTMPNVASAATPQDTSNNFGADSPGQNNKWAGSVGHVIGSLIGGYFGGQAGGIGGGIVGTAAGDSWGNVLAGKDAFNGKSGSVLDNLNPASDYGMASLKQGVMGQGSPWGMFQNQNLGGMLSGALGSVAGGLPGGGGMSPLGGIPNPLQGMLGGR